MKTIEQILQKVNENIGGFESVLDFYYTDLLQFVPFEQAKPFLQEATTLEEWEEYYRPLNEGNVKGVMENYITFAWEKCLGESSNSSLRSIAHYRAWLWILEHDRLREFLNDMNNFPCYGAPMLAEICKEYNWNLQDVVEEWQLEQANNFIEGKGC